MPRRNLMFRVLAAGATFSVGALLVGALTFSPEAAAEKPAPAPAQVASLEQPAPSTKVEPQKTAQKEDPKPAPKSPARKFLPVRSFGGY
ncbi:MAG TPA: hypothetical protein VFF06_25875 [Polyangia bacterium]|nr:hypothetical protein [Polyangia bacterium]